jgi:hypothetical protein
LTENVFIKIKDEHVPITLNKKISSTQNATLILGLEPELINYIYAFEKMFHSMGMGYSKAIRF